MLRTPRQQQRTCGIVRGDCGWEGYRHAGGGGWQEQVTSWRQVMEGIQGKDELASMMRRGRVRQLGRGGAWAGGGNSKGGLDRGWQQVMPPIQE